MIYNFSILAVRQADLTVNHMPATIEAENEYEALGMCHQVAKQCYPTEEVGSWKFDCTLNTGPVITKLNLNNIRIGK